MWEPLFWFSVLAVAWLYVGYPAFLFGAVWRRGPRKILRRDIEPSVTLLIAAHNEEKVIRSKLENALQLDYPKEKLQILVASDGSTDKTESIVREFDGRGVILNALPERSGKAGAQNATAPLARGSILLFSDANALFERDAVRKIVRNFADPSVGAVSGRQALTESSPAGVGRGESLYWKYENVLRGLETQAGSCIAANGCIFAVRRELFAELGRGDSEDFVIPLRLASHGWRVVFEPEAICREKSVAGVADEFHMRLRTAHADSRSLLRLRCVWTPRRPWLAFQCLSHKFLRWCVGLFAAGALLSNVFLIHLPFYRCLFILQLLFYAAAACGFALEGSRKGSRVRTPLFYVPYFFSVANAAALLGLAKGVAGVPFTQIWDKAETTR